MAEKTAGISVPPEKPCTIRNAIKVEKFPLAAQAIDARVNTETAPTKSHRIVSDQIGGLDPAHLILWNIQRALNGR
jgi:hypothetical protein